MQLQITIPTNAIICLFFPRDTNIAFLHRFWRQIFCDLVRVFFVLRALQSLDVLCPAPISVLGMPQRIESVRSEACLKGKKRYRYIKVIPHGATGAESWSAFPRTKPNSILFCCMVMIHWRYFTHHAKNEVFLTDRCGSVVKLTKIYVYG